MNENDSDSLSDHDSKMTEIYQTFDSRNPSKKLTIQTVDMYTNIKSLNES